MEFLCALTLLRVLAHDSALTLSIPTHSLKSVSRTRWSETSISTASHVCDSLLLSCFPTPTLTIQDCPAPTGELPLPYDLNDRMHDDDPDSSDNEEEHREVERANSRVSRIVSNGTTASRRRAPDPSKAAVEGENPLDWRAGPY